MSNTKEWSSVLDDAINESSDLKDAIVGGVSRHLAERAIESYLSDANTFMSTSDAYALVMADPSGMVTEMVEEYGSVAKVPGASGTSIDEVIGNLAERVAYRLIESATLDDLNDLLWALGEVEADGFTIDDIGTGSSVLGNLPHQAESDEYGGSLAYWRRPEGGPDAWVLYLTIADSQVFVRLSKEAEESEDADVA